MAVIRLITVGQINDLFRIISSFVEWDHVLISNQVIHVGCTQGHRKTEIVHLDRRGPVREQPRSMLAEITVEINQNIDLLFANGGTCGRVVKRAIFTIFGTAASMRLRVLLWSSHPLSKA